MAVIRSTSRSALAGLVVVGGLALAGCGAGQIAQTAEQHPTVDGSMAEVGQLSIRDAALEYPTDGLYDKGATARLRMVITNQGIASDTLTSVTSPAADSVAITDPSATAAPGSDSPSASASASDSASPSDTASGSASPSDTASGSASPSDSASGSASPSGSASASPTESPTPTAAAPAQISIPANGYVSFADDGPSVVLTDLTEKLYPAQSLQVTLTFQKAGPVTLTIAVGVPTGQVSLAPTVTPAEG
ncbi:MAG TPA: copper chaperone PCu(A)C [Mycobacteriales bacterium]|nr:copper chaperone PCu(A)C [Mycobacteriales bacterium]